MAEKASDAVIIKRYGNRRLYNTETRRYVNYQELLELIRAGHDIKVIDSGSKEDVTKAVLIQIILEEEKHKKNLLPESFLLQVIRAQEESSQDFFRNYLAATFEAYLRTRQEFERRYREWLGMSAAAPQMWERFFPGAEALKAFWGLGKKEEEEKK